MYNKLLPYKPIIDLFITSGVYSGGGDGLFEIMNVTNRSCPSCLAAALIEANNIIKEHESHL
jgi:hypothetical protein